MSNPKDRSHLTLVKDDIADSCDVAGCLDGAAQRSAALRALRAEAEEFAARTEQNPYSSYSAKHQWRPAREETTGMSRLMNPQLTAADGSIRPRSGSQKIQYTLDEDQQTVRHRIRENSNLLRYAVMGLAEIDMPPESLISRLNPTFDEPIIREHLEHALYYLRRFAEAWKRHETQETPRSS